MTLLPAEDIEAVMSLFAKVSKLAACMVTTMMTATVLSGQAVASSFTIVAQLGRSHQNSGGVDDVLAADSLGNLYAEAAFSDNGNLGCTTFT